MYGIYQQLRNLPVVARSDIHWRDAASSCHHLCKLIFCGLFLQSQWPSYIFFSYTFQATKLRTMATTVHSNTCLWSQVNSPGLRYWTKSWSSKGHTELVLNSSTYITSAWWQRLLINSYIWNALAFRARTLNFNSYSVPNVEEVRNPSYGLGGHHPWRLWLACLLAPSPTLLPNVSPLFFANVCPAL